MDWRVCLPRIDVECDTTSIGPSPALPRRATPPLVATWDAVVTPLRRNRSACVCQWSRTTVAVHRPTDPLTDGRTYGRIASSSICRASRRKRRSLPASRFSPRGSETLPLKISSTDNGTRIEKSVRTTERDENDGRWAVNELASGRWMDCHMWLTVVAAPQSISSYDGRACSCVRSGGTSDQIDSAKNARPLNIGLYWMISHSSAQTKTNSSPIHHRPFKIYDSLTICISVIILE